MINDDVTLTKILDEIDVHQLWVDKYLRSNWWYQFWHLGECLYHHYTAQDLLDLLCQD